MSLRPHLLPLMIVLLELPDRLLHLLLLVLAHLQLRKRTILTLLLVSTTFSRS